MRQSTPSLDSLESWAAADFRSARNQATLKELLARITGKNIDLLSFDEVRLKLHTRSESERVLVVFLGMQLLAALTTMLISGVIFFPCGRT